MKMLKLLDAGVEVPRRAIAERLATAQPGHLEVVETTDQGRHRLLRVARFHLAGNYPRTDNLFDPHLLWWTGPRFVLAGFERVERNGQTVQCAQSWLCLIEADGKVTEEAQDSKREARRAAAALRN